MLLPIEVQFVIVGRAETETCIPSIKLFEQIQCVSIELEVSVKTMPQRLLPIVQLISTGAAVWLT